MNGWAYYNEWEPYAAQWLRNLIAGGHIAPGEVDERSITEVQPDDLKGFVQCHFFAGIGGWSYALRLAGWPDDRPVWTGSCPCQPLSIAGQRKGHADERHLWPAFHRLISECQPPIVFGEQVASKDGREWLAGIRADLEAVGYAVGAADLCAASVGAPHIRQRIWWMADSDKRGTKHRFSVERRARPEEREDSSRHGVPSRPNYGVTGPLKGVDGLCSHWPGQRRCGWCGMGHTNDSRLSQRLDDAGQEGGTRPASPWEVSERANGRRVKPGVRLLVDGVSGRVGQLRGFGNAIVPQVAAEFIRAVM